MGNPFARDKLDNLGVDAVCDMIVDGTTMTSISEQVGVSIASLVAWTAADPERSARVREARAQSAMIWDERALKGIEDSADPFQLARATAAGHHLRWRASKIAPREYGDKIQHAGADDKPLFPDSIRINLVKPGSV